MTIAMLTLQLLSLLSTAAALAPAGPWDAFNLAPDSRVVRPTAIHGATGNVTSPDNLVGGTSTAMATLSGSGSFVTLDWGKEVCGNTPSTLYIYIFLLLLS